MDQVLNIVERSNQRGGRMLSVIDLIEADTLTVAQTAWMLDRIEKGASWLVGAKPGGAGKTTIMSALLAMLPRGERVRLANAGDGWEKSTPGECVVAYEISPGHYDAYIWGAKVCRLAELGDGGCRIVTNLHADTLNEARKQIVSDNGVPAHLFDAFEIFLPITLSGKAPSVESIHYLDGGNWQILDRSPQLTESAQAVITFLGQAKERGLHTVSEVRTAWLAWREDRK